MYIVTQCRPFSTTHTIKKRKKESEKWVTWPQFSTHNFQAEYNRVLYEMEARDVRLTSRGCVTRVVGIGPLCMCKGV